MYTFSSVREVVQIATQRGQSAGELLPLLILECPRSVVQTSTGIECLVFWCRVQKKTNVLVFGLSKQYGDRDPIHLADGEPAFHAIARCLERRKLDRLERPCVLLVVGVWYIVFVLVDILVRARVDSESMHTLSDHCLRKYGWSTADSDNHGV